MRPRCAPAHLLRNVRVFPRSSPSPVLRINLDLLPKSFSSYLLRPIYGLLPLRSQDRTRTCINAESDSTASPLRHLTILWRRGESNPRPEKVAIQCLITRLVTDCKNAVCTVRVDRSQIPPLGLGPRTSNYHFLFQGMAPRDLGYHFVFANEFNSVLKSHV